MRRITFELWLRDDYKALANKEICELGAVYAAFPIASLQDLGKSACRVFHS